EDRLVELLHDSFPAAARAPREGLAVDVRARIGDARAHGLVTERQIAASVAGAWAYGGAFADRSEALRDELTANCRSPEEKAAILLDQIDALSRSREARDV